jgi:hypothetical protein
MDGDEKAPHNKPSALPWERPSGVRRSCSALIDLAVWMTVWIATLVGLDYLARIVLSLPYPSGPDYRDGLFVFMSGIGTLVANLYLAVTNGAGKSVGKALTGLSLVTFIGQYPAKPGFARGLVRSALQAGPCMGALMFLTGVHDTVAGTTIVLATGATARDRWRADSDTLFLDVPRPPRVAAWKIAMAVPLLPFFTMVYMILSAI